MCYYFSKSKGVSLARERFIAAVEEEKTNAGRQEHEDCEIKGQEGEEVTEKQRIKKGLLK